MIKTIKPTTSGQRGMTVINYREILTQQKPEKGLTLGRKRFKGRSASNGRITVRHKGGGHKKLYRLIDFKRNKFDIAAKVKTIEYDPYRTAFISLICYQDGEKRYILHPEGLKVGDEIITSENAPIKTGNRLMLKNIPVGSFVHSVELYPNSRGTLVRSAGSAAQVLAVEGGYVHLKFPSKEIRKIKDTCWATIGRVSNAEHNLINIGKAGRKRHMGIRPTVRGSAMNPCDHPLGGGEGRAPIGLRKGPKTPWGKLAYGVKTRRRKKWSNKFILKRRK